VTHLILKRAWASLELTQLRPKLNRHIAEAKEHIVRQKKIGGGGGPEH
jgi:hypothetical protein